MVEQYDALIQKFVNDNMATLLASRRYKTPKEGEKESNLNYLPEHNQKADPGYIGESPEFKVLLDTFIDTFIYRDDITFKMQGHMADLDTRSIAYVMDNVDYYDRDNILYEFDMKVLIDVFAAFLGIRDGVKINYFTFSYGKNKVEFQSSLRCRACNEYLTMIIDYDQMAVVPLLKKPPCPMATIPKNIIVELQSPSGKLVFLNDPREFLKIERDNQYKVSINSTLGCIQETNAYAEHNVGYFFIGNCMPYIFQHEKKDKILFSSFDEESVEDEQSFQDYNELGYICTGLWWYSILDHQLYLDLCAAKGIDPESIEHTVAVTGKPTFKVDHDLTAHTEGHHHGVYSTITY